MLNKALIIEMLNWDVEKYQQYNNLYKKAENINERNIQWNNMYRLSCSLNARKQMCTAFGYEIVYGENEKILDIEPRYKE